MKRQCPSCGKIDKEEEFVKVERYGGMTQISYDKLLCEECAKQSFVQRRTN